MRASEVAAYAFVAFFIKLIGVLGVAYLGVCGLVVLRAVGDTELIVSLVAFSILER